jgi:hypothetical protein
MASARSGSSAATPSDSRKARLLTRLQEEMDHAASLEQVREVAAETERIMREENSDWFGVMRFHDMELIT